METEHVKFLGQVSTIMRDLTSKDGDLLSYFDNINHTDENTSMNNISLNVRLINSHSVEVNRGKIKGQLALEHLFVFCKTFKKITKNLGFHLNFKTADLQNIIFTSIASDIDVTINSLYLYVPLLILDGNTQVMFNESIKSIYTITCDSWYIERKVSTDGNELQVDIGSARHIDSPKYLIGSFETADRIVTPGKKKNIVIFDNVNVKRYFCEIDGFGYPKDAVLANFPENDYLDQYRDLKFFYKEYLCEILMNPFIPYTDLKNKYPIQVIDLRHQVDHITPTKIQLFEEINNDPHNANARLFFILVRHRQIEMIPDGNKTLEIKVI